MLRVFQRMCGFAVLSLILPVMADAYTIKYNLMGGVNHPDNPTSYGVNDEVMSVVLKNPTREGYAFLGWFIESSDSRDFKTSGFTNISFGGYQGYSASYVGELLGNFSVYARWGLVPKTPQKDERGCYFIHSAEELYGIMELSRPPEKYHSWYEFEGCVSLQNDIVVNKNLLDANGDVAMDDYVWWIPLVFRGSFEGNGYSISGLRGDAGLFIKAGEEGGWRADKSVVRNLGLKDSYFTDETAGAIVGTAVGPMLISNVYTDASVHGEYKAGGLVGAIQATNDNCPCALPSASPSFVLSLLKDEDYSRIVLIENAYSVGRVDGKNVGGITAEMDAALLRNVYFAGELKGNESDCIVRGKGFTCYASEAVFEVENALCMESADTTISKAKSLSREQFKDGTALEILLAGENGSSWVQNVGTDSFPKVGGSYKFEIRYFMNGGVNNEENPTGYAKGDAAIVLKDPQKENDTFEGWFTDNDFTQKVDTVKTQYNGDWKLYAKWKSFYKINFVLNAKDGSVNIVNYSNTTRTVRWAADSSAFKLPNLTRSGYDFEGWFTDSLFENKVTEIPAGNTEDVTTYAKWKPSTYTVTYHLYGGTNHPDNPQSYTVLDTPFVLNNPVREGAVFRGWRSFSLGGPEIKEIRDDRNLNLYAEWTPETKKPEQNSNGCYLLKTREELYWFAELSNNANGNFAECASLENDIVVNENVLKGSQVDLANDSLVVWDYMCQNIGNSFHGTFAGNGHVISGLVMFDENPRCSLAKNYGGLFCVYWSDDIIKNVKINDSYIEEFGVVDQFTVGPRSRIALPDVAVKSGLRVDVDGNSVALSGLVAGRTLLVMDVQGRVLRRLTTKSSMVVDLPKAGNFLIRYGSETRAVTIR